ncbi:MAG: pentapeptide repeat-containing protein [Candidatus Caenarcaniphilales bacterium]|nr:pentapeptide repeat-containing protein [Candidatus Caenarcaniphilales bacterium]
MITVSNNYSNKVDQLLTNYRTRFTNYIDSLIKQDINRENTIQNSKGERMQEITNFLDQELSLKSTFGQALINSNNPRFFIDIKEEKKMLFQKFFRFIDNVLQTSVDFEPVKIDFQKHYMSIKRIVNDLGISFKGVDFSKYDLRKADLSGLDLSDQDLSMANLDGADLSRANLSGTNLSKMDLNKVNFSDANFKKADLTGTDIKDSNLCSANFEEVKANELKVSNTDAKNTNFNQAYLNQSQWNDVNFFEADLTRANLEKGAFKDCNFIKTRSHDANYKEAELDNIKISETEMQDTNLEGAVLTNFKYDKPNEEFEYSSPQSYPIDLSRIKLSSETKLPEDLSYAQLDGIVLPDNYDLSPYNLKNSKLGWISNLNDPAKLPQNLEGTEICSALIQSIDLSDKNLDNAFITSLNKNYKGDRRQRSFLPVDHLPPKLKNVIFERCNFDGQDLRSVNFDSSCEFRTCSFVDTIFPDDFDCKLIRPRLGKNTSRTKMIKLADFKDACTNIDFFCDYFKQSFNEDKLGVIQTLSNFIQNKGSSFNFGKTSKENLQILNVIVKEALEEGLSFELCTEFMENFLNHQFKNDINSEFLDNQEIEKFIIEGLSEHPYLDTSFLKILSRLEIIDSQFINSIEDLSEFTKLFIANIDGIEDNENKEQVINNYLSSDEDCVFAKLTKLAIEKFNIEDFDQFCDKLSEFLFLDDNKNFFDQSVSEIVNRFETEEMSYRKLAFLLDSTKDLTGIPRISNQINTKKYFKLNPSHNLLVGKNFAGKAVLANENISEYAKVKKDNFVDINSFANCLHPATRKDLLNIFVDLNALKKEFTFIENFNKDLANFEESSDSEKLFNIADSQLLVNFPELLEKVVEQGTGQHSLHDFPLMKHNLIAINKANDEFKLLKENTSSLKTQLPYSKEDLEDLNIVLMAHDLGKLTVRNHSEAYYNSNHDQESVRLLEIFSQRMGFNQLRKGRLHRLFFAKRTLSDINNKESLDHQAYLIGDKKTLELGLVATKAHSYAVHQNDDWFNKNEQAIIALKSNIEKGLNHRNESYSNATLFNILNYPEQIARSSMQNEIIDGALVSNIYPDKSLVVHVTGDAETFARDIIELSCLNRYDNPLDTALLSTSKVTYSRPNTTKAVHGASSDAPPNILGVSSDTQNTIAATNISMSSGVKKTLGNHNAEGSIDNKEILVRFIDKHADDIKYHSWKKLTLSEQCRIIEDLLIYHMTYKPEVIFGDHKTKLHEFVSPKARQDFINLYKEISDSFNSLDNDFNELVMSVNEVNSLVIPDSYLNKEKNIEDSLSNDAIKARLLNIPIYLLKQLSLNDILEGSKDEQKKSIEIFKQKVSRIDTDNLEGILKEIVDSQSDANNLIQIKSIIDEELSLRKAIASGQTYEEFYNIEEVKI